MWKDWFKNEWRAQLTVFIGYVFVIYALFPFTISYFLPVTAAIRLGCLLLIPYRYWLALTIADIACLAQLSYLCASVFGNTWAILEMTPRIALIAPIVWWCRERLTLFPTKRLINMQTLLICTVFVSLTWTLFDVGLTLTAKQPTGHTVPIQPIILPYMFFQMYIAILSAVPWVLIAKVEYRYATPLRQRVQDFFKYLFAWDSMTLAFCAGLFLFWISRHNMDEVRHISLMAVFFPIAWMMLKPGWRAASVGSTLATIFVCIPLELRPDPEVVQAEAFIAVIITCLLVLGARIAAQRQQQEQQTLDAEQAILLARQNINLAEMRMRKSAQALEMAGSALHLSNHQLLTRFDSLLSSHEAQRYHRQATATQSQVSQIVDSLHPTAWRERGLPAALRETIGRALREVGIAYRCDLKGHGLFNLTPDVQTAIYRLACESVVHINTQMICSRVSVCLRTGITRNVRWAVLRVDGIVEPAHINDAVYDIGERQFLASKLGAHDLDSGVLRDYVRLFDGALRVRANAKGLRLSCLLIDKPGLDLKQTPLSLMGTLWVT